MFKAPCEWNMHAILRIKNLLTRKLIRINNIITNSHNLHFRRHNVKPAGYNKQYMDASRIEAELYSLVDKFNNRRITSRTFCDTFLDKIHSFADGNGRTCKILFDDKIESFYKIYKKVTWFIFLFRFVSGPLQDFVSGNVIFSKLCSVFYKYHQRRICFHVLCLIYRSSQSYYQ